MTFAVRLALSCPCCSEMITSIMSEYLSTVFYQYYAHVRIMPTPESTEVLTLGGC